MATTGGTLSFDLYQDDDGDYFVKVFKEYFISELNHIFLKNKKFKASLS